MSNSADISISRCESIPSDIANAWMKEPYLIQTIEDLLGVFVSYNKDYEQVSQLLTISQQLLIEIITEITNLLGSERIAELEQTLPLEEWGLGLIPPDSRPSDDD